jgi:putative transposase
LQELFTYSLEATMAWIEESGLKRLFRARMKPNYPGILSHITQRAAGADLLFHEEDDYLEFLGRMKNISGDFHLEIISFACMPNHIHIQVRQTEPNLPEAMKELFGRFARRQNIKYQRKGHLFGGPYRQAICLDNIYSLMVSLYIHLNPVRAGLTDDPLKYRWSSCSLFCRDDKPRSFLYPEKILEQLSNDHGKAVEIYRKSLFEGMKIRSDEVLEDQEAIHRFQAEMSKLPEAKNIVRLLLKKISGENTHKINQEYDFIGLMNEVAERQPVKMPKDKAARKYFVEQLLSRGYTRKEIARRLNVSRKTLYNIITTSLPIYGQTGFG